MLRLLMAGAVVLFLALGVTSGQATHITDTVFVHEPVGGVFNAVTYKAWLNCGWHRLCDGLRQPADENQNATDWQWPGHVTQDTFIRLKIFDPSSTTVPVARLKVVNWDDICNGVLAEFYPLGGGLRIGAVAYWHTDSIASFERDVFGNSAGKTNSSKVGVYGTDNQCAMTGPHTHTYYINSTLGFDIAKNTAGIVNETTCSTPTCDTVDLYTLWHWRFSFKR